ncbi:MULTISPECIES: GLPGLI family protein [Chryseobacterium]|jgi:GLPGLI family protein|uniref:GLPGLI family protein n=1 Tax=Chryseobacterium piscium TaxID=333702 RepID=A0A3D9BLT8_9FLAO|nr:MULTISPECIES: GLPGLI family protein [Chryseobacterium]MDY0929875.1 GLPGLI family protein [Chryseobacterium sp. CFBP8996]REC45800.1 GLPGLI family protein [Chryseobacterium sp. 5_R23647]REC54495.1 GLPGLI family protein [Chryseobacterium piscium]
MKNLFSILFIAVFAFANAQESKESSNRFFYELTFKPKQDSAKLDKVITVLDITDKNRSVYQDYTVISQDSITKIEIETMQKAGVYKDLSKSLKTPKFSARIHKFYPSMKIEYVDKVANGMTPVNIAYTEDLKFNWKISDEKQKIGEYNTQKATTEYGGRTWTAWFSTDLPFQDGPYKFSGLPGLIVKIEDAGKNYSWILQGNKKIKEYNEFSYIESLMQATGGKPKELTREKFDKTFNDFKKDPFASVRPMMSQEIMSKPMPGTDGTIGDMMKKQEKMYKDFYNANDNPIEKANSISVGNLEKVGKEKDKK